MSELRRKREQAKALLRKAQINALAEGRGALANMHLGYIIRVDAGRYDHRLDEFIAELRG